MTSGVIAHPPLLLSLVYFHLQQQQQQRKQQQRLRRERHQVLGAKEYFSRLRYLRSARAGLGAAAGSVLPLAAVAKFGSTARGPPTPQPQLHFDTTMIGGVNGGQPNSAARVLPLKAQVTGLRFRKMSGNHRRWKQRKTASVAALLFQATTVKPRASALVLVPTGFTLSFARRRQCKAR